MNIGELRSILGEAVSNEVRTLELKVGQVVRGVVAQQLDNNEAIVNINGVQVRAKLEIPLMEGQAALMQVHPDSKGNYILLKQVDPTTLGFNDPMKDILKAMGLPDKQWAIDVVRQLRAEGIALNKETTSAFQRVVASMPPGMNMEQWIQAAVIAARRGLPMTEATILSISQLMNGSPIHTLMEQLRGQLQLLLQGMQSSAQQSNSNSVLQPLFQQLSLSLEQGQQLVRHLTGGTDQLSQSASNQVNYQPAASQAVNQGLEARAGAAAAELSSGAVNQQLIGTASGQGVQTSQAIAQLLKWLGVDYEMVLGKQLLGRQEAGAVASSSVNQTSVFNVGTQQFLSQTQQSMQQANSQQQGSQTTASMPAQSSQTQANQLVSPNQQQAVPSSHATSVRAEAAGSGLQAQATTPAPQTQTAPLTAQPSVQANMTAPSQEAANGGQQQALQSQAQQNAAQIQTSSMPLQQALNDASVGQGVYDNLKASLLQLLQQPEASSAVKETAQQLLHAITGQQLMLATERNNAMFSHMMMYIPLHDQDGSQTAKVHIQTRRDRKGAMDAENCRIVFDLNMNTLGATLVDVHITNKVISLHVWNDHPATQPLVEQMKPAVLEALLRTGYTLSSLRATSLMERNASVESDKEQHSVQPPIESYASAKRYKGVDIKA